MGQHYWMMSPAEQAALVFLLEHLRPKVAIEIGTRFGGSLQVLAQFCDRVYSLDVDPEVPQRLEGKYSNVEYLIGLSDQTLPPLIDRLQREGAELSFALVDGDHSTEGVRRDIDNLLRFRPTIPFYIIMHDSFMPCCRDGLKQANWSANPHIHAVELDFVPGIVNPAPKFRNELCGGLALGILLGSSAFKCGTTGFSRSNGSFRPLFALKNGRAGRADEGPSGRRTGIRLADRSDLAVFPWTRECGTCPMRVQESRARSRTTRSRLIREISAQAIGCPDNVPHRIGFIESSITRAWPSERDR